MKHQENIFEEFAKSIREIEEVSEAWFTAGEYDAFLKVILKDMNADHNFVLHQMSKMNIISNVRSNFVLQRITDSK